MSKLEELTDPLVPACCQVPPAGPGTCDVCHSAADGGGATCTSCERTMGDVSTPTRLVVPMSLYLAPSQLWRVLRYYKDVPADSTAAAFERIQAKFQWQVAALLARFTRDHAHCIATAAGAEWDTVTSVPSSGARAGPHPLEHAVQRVPWLRGPYVPLLRRSDLPVAARRAADGRYSVTQSVEGRCVLLIDDSFASGSSAQSAASALARAGARVAATLVIGRAVRPEWSVRASEHWEAARKKPFRFDVCCVGDHSA